ncbi:MAG TPA: alpha/beta fold hydrolase [Gaiellaceae bacterium]|nr:alpha/beta fold hydrolase [Gaiellaceae bacterium]
MRFAFTPLHRGGEGAPLLLLHGFTDTWRTWELVLPRLERRHTVLAPTLAGHTGGPPLDGAPTETALVEAVERLLDEERLETVDVAGNSLGGYVALQLAARGRARSVVAFAPAGDEEVSRETLPYFRSIRRVLERSAGMADRVVATPEGRRAATRDLTVRFEHIPAELIAHQLVGAARCPAALPLIERGERGGWPLDASRVTCPVRIVWGAEDRLLPWPAAADRWLRELPQAELVVLDGVGHCPQLDVPPEAAELILGFL